MHTRIKQPAMTLSGTVHGNLQQSRRTMYFNFSKRAR